MLPAPRWKGSLKTREPLKLLPLAYSHLLDSDLSWKHITPPQGSQALCWASSLYLVTTNVKELTT